MLLGWLISRNIVHTTIEGWRPVKLILFAKAKGGGRFDAVVGCVSQYDNDNGGRGGAGVAS